MTAKKLSAALALPLLLTSIGASADLLSDITAHGDLKCAVYSDVPPFSSPDVKTRQLVGMDVDLARRWQRKWG